VRDASDFLIGILVAGVWIAGTVYLFRFHSDANFAIWGGICTTMTGAYHFLRIRDDKEKDSC